MRNFITRSALALAAVAAVLSMTEGTASAAQHSSAVVSLGKLGRVEATPKGNDYFGLGYGATATPARIAGKVEPFINVSG